MSERPSYEDLLRRLSEMELELEYSKANSNKVQSVFLSNISHEIRTPLNAIVGFANLVAEDKLSREEKKELAFYIRNASDSLIELVNNLIDVSLVQAGKLQLNPENCFTDRVIDEVIRKFHLCETGFRLSHQPCRDGYMLFTCDKKRLVQVLYNMLKFISQYSPGGDIVLSYKYLNSQIHFEISVSGVHFETARQELLDALGESKSRHHQSSGNLIVSALLFLTEALNGEIYVDESFADRWSLVLALNYEKENHQETNSTLSDKHHPRNIAI
jgi:K+-sensing histidine kinase KdpD